MFFCFTLPDNEDYVVLVTIPSLVLFSVKVIVYFSIALGCDILSTFLNWFRISLNIFNLL